VLLGAESIQPEQRQGPRTAERASTGKPALFGRIADWIKNGFF